MSAPVLRRLFLAAVLALSLGCQGQILRIHEENDVGGFGGGTDRYYTQGLVVEFTQPLGDPVPGVSHLARALWLQPGPDDYVAQKQYVGLAGGQSIFTPEDITVKTVQKDDRPYAGWLYGMISYYNLALSAIPRPEDEGDGEDATVVVGDERAPLVFTRDDRLDSLEFQAGIVGPSSYADETQTRFHKIIGADEPQGWDNQLQDELGLNLYYSRRYRNNHNRLAVFEQDLITNFGGAFGNVYTHFQVGGMVRLGHNLRRDFGLGAPDLSLEQLQEMMPSLTEPQVERLRSQFGEAFSWYFFAGVDGRFVVWNIFLDGNTSKDSHSVEKERFVADFRAGIAFQFRHFEISYAQVARTPEFRRASDPQIFGSLNVGFRF